MLRFFVVLVSVARAAEEPPKVSKYDECVATPKRAQETLFAQHSQCTETDEEYCLTCLPSIMEILDHQRDCCKAVEGQPDAGMLSNASDVCYAAMAAFKAQEISRCKDKVPASAPDSKVKKYQSCMKVAMDAKIAVTVAHPDCKTSQSTYCDTCYTPFKYSVQLMEGCCEHLKGEPEAGMVQNAYDNCLRDSANAKVDEEEKCPGKVAADLDPAFAISNAAQCHDITDHESRDDYKECYTNVIWARDNGLKEHPEYYEKYTFLNAQSSILELQQALFLMKGARAGKSWDCPMPCSGNAAFEDFIMATDAAVEGIEDQMKVAKEQMASSTPTIPKYTASASTGGGTGSWKWMLLALGCCCCLPLIGLVCSAFICYESVAWIFGGDDKPQKRKTRKIVLKKEAPAPQPQEALQPVRNFVQMSTLQPYPVAMPQMMQTVPTYSVPVPMAQPLVSYQMPVQTVQYVHPI